jgi:hypothetical protein
MAALYQDADVHVVRRLAVLLDEFAAGERRHASEMRQLEDRLGLSPLGRRRLAWDLAQVTPPPAAEVPDRGADAVSEERLLRVVRDP